MSRARFRVAVCHEYGTLDNCPRGITWDVVDTERHDADGYSVTVSNHPTRAAARAEAATRNTEPVEQPPTCHRGCPSSCCRCEIAAND